MEKDLKDISVSELAAQADINRGTFYRHYKDIYDLFEQIETEILKEFTGIIAEHARHTRMLWAPVLHDLFKYIAANAETFRAILRTRETTFLAQITALNRPRNEKEWRRLFVNGKEEFYEYYYDFIAFGCIALLRRWFDRGMPESPRQMAALVEKMMENCLRNL